MKLIQLLVAFPAKQKLCKERIAEVSVALECDSASPVRLTTSYHGLDDSKPLESKIVSSFRLDDAHIQ